MPNNIFGEVKILIRNKIFDKPLYFLPPKMKKVLSEEYKHRQQLENINRMKDK